MASEKDKLQKVDVEPLPPKEAKQEKQELKRAATTAKVGAGDELDGVEKIPPAQAREEMQEAVKKLKKN